MGSKVSLKVGNEVHYYIELLKKQNKQIDKNIELIIQNQKNENDSFLLLAKKTLNLAKKQKLMLNYYYIECVWKIFALYCSSVSSAINSMAAVALEDYIRPLFKHYKNRDMSLNAGVWTARGLGNSQANLF